MSEHIGKFTRLMEEEGKNLPCFSTAQKMKPTVINSTKIYRETDPKDLSICISDWTDDELVENYNLLREFAQSLQK